MIDLDHWREILDTIGKNRLRTFLTGFSVAWGIFMLVVLLGSGEGLANGVQYQFRDDAMNSIWVRPGTTSVPHQGLQPGRRVQLTNLDYDRIRGGDQVEHITSRFYIKGQLTVRYGPETGTFDIRSVHPDHRFLENTIVTRGRFLNDLDLREFRKTAVIGQRVEKALFRGADSLGEWIHVNGIAFRVVGVFRDEGGEGEEEKIYLPISTSQRTFNGANLVNQVMMTTQASVAEADDMSKAIKADLAQRHHFAPADPRAAFVWNNLQEYQRYLDMIGGIRLFVWVIGFGTILAGVVGVSNIMLITVRDRTKEIGIRKALGATPGSIVRLVLQESLLITVVAGSFGLVLGVGLLELVGGKLPDSSFFRKPSVDIGPAVQALALLVGAGALAGFIPARRAAAIRPIEALHDE